LKNTERNTDGKRKNVARSNRSAATFQLGCAEYRDRVRACWLGKNCGGTRPSLSKGGRTGYGTTPQKLTQMTHSLRRVIRPSFSRLGNLSLRFGVTRKGWTDVSCLRGCDPASQRHSRRPKGSYQLILLDERPGGQKNSAARRAMVTQSSTHAPASLRYGVVPCPIARSGKGGRRCTI
jgi:hypothetical protein